MKLTGNKKRRYTISVGLNDKEEKKQLVQTESVLRLVKNCCKNYDTAFSSYLQDGGYIHDNGEFVLEKRDVTLMWKGSSNQRVINVKETLKKTDPTVPVLHCSDHYRA